MWLRSSLLPGRVIFELEVVDRVTRISDRNIMSVVHFHQEKSKW